MILIDFFYGHFYETYGHFYETYGHFYETLNKNIHLIILEN